VSGCVGLGGHGGSCRSNRSDRAGQMRVRGTTHKWVVGADSPTRAREASEKGV